MFAGRHRYLILLLVTSALGMALVDRAVMSIAAPSLSHELGMDSVALGWLFSSFTWSYVVAQLPAGWLVDRMGARRAVMVCLMGWAVVSACLGLVGNLSHALYWMVVLRILAGLLQGPIVPASGMSIAAWFPASERGFAGAMFGSSNYLWLAVFTPLLGWLSYRFGWQSMFYCTSAAVALLGWAWWRNFHMPRAHRRVHASEIVLLEEGGAAVDIGTRAKASSRTSLGDLKAMLSNRMVLGILISQYGISAVTWFYVTWFPIYLVQGRGMTLVEAGAAASIPALCGFAGGVSAGVFSDRLLKATGSLSVARMLPVLIGAGMMVVSFVGCIYAGPDWLVVALLSVALFGKGFSTLVWTLVGDVFPARTIGLAGGVVNTMANVSGIVTTIAIGYLVSLTGSLDSALWLMAGHAAMAMISHVLLVRKVEPMEPGPPVTAAAIKSA
ncbi:glucarate transporter GudP [soil metagenome]